MPNVMQSSKMLIYLHLSKYHLTLLLHSLHIYIYIYYIFICIYYTIILKLNIFKVTNLLKLKLQLLKWNVRNGCIIWCHFWSSTCIPKPHSPHLFTLLDFGIGLLARGVLLFKHLSIGDFAAPPQNVTKLPLCSLTSLKMLLHY